MTADELLQMPRGTSRHELFRGELRTRSLRGARTGEIGAVMIAHLGTYVRQRSLGIVCSSGTGFVLARHPDTVFAPVAAFVASPQFIDSGFSPRPPDVAIEIGDDANTEEWLNAGTRAVIVVDPRTRSVTVRRSSGVTIVGDTIEVEDVIPSWRLPLAELFG